MKKSMFLLALAVMTLCNASAQNYQEKTDTIWGRNSYQETDGLPTTLSWDLKSFENVVQKIALYNGNMYGGDTHLVYYIHLPEGHSRADIKLKTKAGKQADFDFALTDPINGDTLQHHRVVAAEEGAMQTVELMPDINIEKDGWYRFDLYLYDLKEYVDNVQYLVFQRESKNIVTTPRIYSTLATYLNGWRSTDPKAPSGQSYDICYVEVYVPEESDWLSTYYSTMNVIGGYMGIQTAIHQDKNNNGAVDYRGEYQHNLIFSVWDNGDTDITPNLPEYLKSGALDSGPDVEVNRFGSEGTGVNTMKTYGYGGKWWKPGHWVQMLCTARPEEIDVVLEDGQTIKYPNTLITAWYKMAEDNEWNYLATLRRSGESSYFDGWNSFLENWNSWGGQFTRNMYMRNGYMRSLASNTWYHRNSITTGYYYAPKRLYSNQRDRRLDFAFDVSEEPETEGAFHMKVGGYFTMSDGKNFELTVPLKNDGVSVDTINVENLMKRVDQALIKDKSKEIQSKIVKGNTSSKRKALAESILAQADQFNGYKTEDLQELKEVYGDGESINHTALRQAMMDLANNCMPLKYGVVARKANIGSFRAYQLYNTKGGGIVTGTEVDGVKTLRASSATVEGATEEAAEQLSVLDPNTNWMLLHQDGETDYYLYNIGQKQYLDMSQPGMLSDDPVAVTVNQSTGGYIFKQGNLTLNAVPTSSTATINAVSSGGEYTIFELRDNYSMKPTSEEVKQQFEFINAMKDLQTTLAGVPQLLAIPKGAVGSLKNEDDLQQVTQLYNNGKVASGNGAKLVSLLSTAPRVEFAPEQTLYRLRSAHPTYGTTRPFATVNDNHKFTLAKEDGTANQLFSLKKAAPSANPTDMNRAPVKINGGYMLRSQGLGFNTFGTKTGTAVEAVEAAEASAIFFTERNSGQFILSNTEGSDICMTASTRGIYTGTTSNTGAPWFLQEVSEMKVNTNATGFVPSGLFVDFDVELPQGLEAYVVDGVTADGQVKLQQIEGQHIPARTAVILRGAKDTEYSLHILPPTAPEEPIENLLQGTLMKKEGMTENGYFLLDFNGDKPVFRQSPSSTINTYNTIFLVKEGPVPEMETLTIDLTPTGIILDEGFRMNDESNNPSSLISHPSSVYDLQGRKIADNPSSLISHPSSPKGVIISKGKKIVNK